jgi:hypothetical protein
MNYVYQHLPLQDIPKLNQIAIFGLKIYHLATRIRDWAPLCLVEELSNPEEGRGLFLRNLP